MNPTPYIYPGPYALYTIPFTMYHIPYILQGYLTYKKTHPPRTLP